MIPNTGIWANAGVSKLCAGNFNIKMNACVKMDRCWHARNCHMNAEIINLKRRHTDGAGRQMSNAFVLPGRFKHQRVSARLCLSGAVAGYGLNGNYTY